ncbi:MAG TPA: hypothetical protein VGM78_01015, partial [Ilumatobacteraceae bacterium]
MGGVAALVAGELYQRFGRATAYTTCAVAMVALVGIGLWCVGRTWAARPPADDPEAVPRWEPDPTGRPNCLP